MLQLRAPLALALAAREVGDRARGCKDGTIASASGQADSESAPVPCHGERPIRLGSEYSRMSCRARLGPDRARASGTMARAVAGAYEGPIVFRCTTNLNNQNFKASATNAGIVCTIRHSSHLSKIADVRPAD